MDLANPWILIQLKVLRNCVSAKFTKIHLNNFNHPPTKFDGHTPCGCGHMFLVCDVTWPHNQRATWFGREKFWIVEQMRFAEPYFWYAGWDEEFLGWLGWLGHYVG